MIIVDTNVISETLRPARDQGVVEWLDKQVIETLYLTATIFSELRLGIEVLPAGKRKNALSTDVNDLIATFFSERILPFDREAARVYGELAAEARSKGRGVSVTDGQIAAVARVHGFTVATRDTAPFEAIEIPVINPWKKHIK